MRYHMNSIRVFCVLVSVLALASSAALADDGSALWGWNVSGGANFGFGLRTDLKVSPANALRAMPALTPAVGPTRKAAAAARTPVTGGPRVDYDESGSLFVDPSSSWGEAPGHESETWNWRLPDAAAEGRVVGEGADRRFEMAGGEWSEVVSRSETTRSVSDDDGSVAYGASVDLSHALWMSEDATWGVDVVIGLTWLKAFDCFRAGGVAASRTATVENGDTVTSIPGAFFANEYARAEADDTWGNGRYDGSDPNRDQYLIDLDRVTTTSRTLGARSYSDSMSVSAHGDYEEWEISLLLKPWYDVNDWLCLHGLVGMGVTRSSFEFSMDAVSGGSTVYRSSQEFDEWRCYGLIGGGVLFRVYDFDLSCDGLFRWCQQDMDINGKDVHGTIEKPWATVRLGLSYAF